MARTQKDAKPVADLKNPPSRFETVDPDESPDRGEGKYFGTSPEYENAADHKFTPDGEAPDNGDEPEEDDEAEAAKSTGTTPAPPAPPA